MCEYTQAYIHVWTDKMHWNLDWFYNFVIIYKIYQSAIVEGMDGRYNKVTTINKTTQYPSTS